MAFNYFGKLSGLVPLIGVVAGPCFAGNAALLGCCDVVIATKDSNIGMGGPAMIEGGGLGVFRPDEIGPSSVQSRNGVIDVLVKNALAEGRTAPKYHALTRHLASRATSGTTPVIRASRRSADRAVHRFERRTSMSSIRRGASIGSRNSSAGA